MKPLQEKQAIKGGISSPAKWVWMPHAAHFIMGSDCRFVLATYVGGYIVSTVGELVPDSRVREIHAEAKGVKIEGMGDAWDADYHRKLGFEELGLGRTYETMVFEARKADPKKCPACPYVIDSGRDLDMEGYTNGGDAYKGHLKLCRKWSRGKKATLTGKDVPK